MSSKSCLVIVYKNENDDAPIIVKCPKDTYFSRKDAQRIATEKVRVDAMHKAEVVEVVMVVR